MVGSAKFSGKAEIGESSVGYQGINSYIGYFPYLGKVGDIPGQLFDEYWRRDLPLMNISPFLAGRSPAIVLKRVVLPQPLGPIRHTKEPLSI